ARPGRPSVQGTTAPCWRSWSTGRRSSSRRTRRSPPPRRRRIPSARRSAVGRLRLKNLPAAFRSCLAAHGVTKVSRASLTDPKVIAAGEAWLGYLPPGERQQLLGAGGENLALGLYSWTDLTYLLHKHGVSWAYYVQ